MEHPCRHTAISSVPDVAFQRAQGKSSSVEEDPYRHEECSRTWCSNARTGKSSSHPYRHEECSRAEASRVQHTNIPTAPQRAHRQVEFRGRTPLPPHRNHVEEHPYRHSVLGQA